MVMQDQDTLQKLTGDFKEDLPESVYREIASVIVKSIGDRVFHSFDSRMEDEDIKDILKGKEQIGEFVVGYILAAVLDLIPLGDSEGIGTKLAHYFRVQAFQGIDDLILKQYLIPIIKEKTGSKGEVEKIVVLVFEDDDHAPTSATQRDPAYRIIAGTAHRHKHEHGGSNHYHQHSHRNGEERHDHEGQDVLMLKRDQEHETSRYHGQQP
jgi:hypothetical protein